MNTMKKTIRSAYSTVLMVLFLSPTMIQAAAINNPLTGSTKSLSAPQIIGNIVQSILGVTGVIALAFIVLGGVRIAFAAGNEQRVQKGKQTLLFAIVGLIIAFSGFIIIREILELPGFFRGSFQGGPNR